MRKGQWRALGWMFLVFCFLTMITGSVASVQEDPYPFLRMYGYFALLWVVAAIACFICGWLEKEEAE